MEKLECLNRNSSPCTNRVNLRAYFLSISKNMRKITILYGHTVRACFALKNTRAKYSKYTGKLN